MPDLRASTRSAELLRMADAVLQPGFEGTTAPEWLLRRLAAGLRGVALFGRNIETLEQVADLTAAMRAERGDVIVGIDEEAGDVTRLESHTGSSRPGNLALGYVDDVALTERVARDVGADLAAGGITLDYAPDADVNSNADNPVIGVRSFGRDPALVARHTAAWVRGLHAAGVAACAKHFPGHGSTNVDSHEDLPTIVASRQELAERDLVPFRAAIEAGLRVVMTGHLLVPAYDPHRPATLSRPILVDLLRGELGFDGLVVSDGIEMRAVTTRFGLAGAAVGAIAAGCDVICVGGDHADEETALALRDAIADAVAGGALAEERLAEAAGRVARFAAWSVAARRSARPAPGHAVDGGDVPSGLAAARRAVSVTATGGVTGLLPLRQPPHVVELDPSVNRAIGRATPWGLAQPLARLLPGTTAVRLHSSDLSGDGGADRALVAALAPAAGRPVVIVVRDAHRHLWVTEALRTLVAARPDATVVEMGVPNGAPPGAVYLATHGASRVSGEAAAETLAGRRR
ncbi:MAG TPA: glycoside hydrolase family 3 N-terminal domain-containing protein [Micromonosporaceae bacterium]|nr:glycoside hydrolase family 3 N-terminal domain-containing protein [Micromonosporaceae bacterium]